MAEQHNQTPQHNHAPQKKHYLNAGTLIFGAILIYIVLIVYSGMHVTKLSGYEVMEGSLAVDSTYRGVALRTEQVVSANNNGYINYYAGESRHISRSGLVYSIDESGVLSEMIKDSAAINTVLSDEDLSELRTELISFSSTYDDGDFDDVYNMQISLENTIRKLANQSALENLRSVSNNAYSDLIDMGYSPDSGVIVYNHDGLENVTASGVTEDTFNEAEHPKEQLIDGELVSMGDPAYKLITSENWQIVFPLDDTTKEALSDNKAVKVRFLKNDYESTADVELITNEDKDYGVLYLRDSMINFATDRYVDIELKIDEVKGLKVPNSAIVSRKFYVIPVEFASNADAGDEAGFLRKTYLEDGSESTEYMTVDIYNSEDDMFYVDTSAFNNGDVIVKKDSQDEYTIGAKESLTGVYNMNKGYADFTKISVINANKEYSIVESESMYDLQVYDYIVLDGDGVNDSDFVTDTDFKKTQED